jgi:undecaprenyl-diphosphatase
MVNMLFVLVGFLAARDYYSGTAVVVAAALGIIVYGFAIYVRALGVIRKKVLPLTVRESWKLALSAFTSSILFYLIGYGGGLLLYVLEARSVRAGIFVVTAATILVLVWGLIQFFHPTYLFFRSISRSIVHAVAQNEDMRALIARYPRLAAFTHARLDNTHLTGFPLTLIVVAGGYAFFLFVGVIQAVINVEAIAQWDVRVANLMYAFRDDELLQLFTWVTAFGSTGVVVTITVITALLLYIYNARAFFTPFLVSVISTQLFTTLFKNAIHRPRPDLAFYVEQSFSFPSGHAAMSFVVYGFVAYILTRSTTRWRTYAAVMLSTVTIVCAIGLSRMYLGVHFLSDVWGGYLLGLLFLVIGISATQVRLRTVRYRTWPAHSLHTYATLASLFAFICGVAVIAGLVRNYAPEKAPYAREVEIVRAADPFDAFLFSNVSRYSEAISGDVMEPMNFMFLAEDDAALIDAFERAGWHLADTVTFGSLLKISKAAILGEGYLEAPMTPSFWNAHAHDFGFQKPLDVESIHQRHHFRVWKTPIESTDGRKLYVATGSLDSGLKYGITHTIDPDIDTEREYLFTDLRTHGAVESAELIQIVKPVLGQNFSGDPFFTDGKSYKVILTGKK